MAPVDLHCAALPKGTRLIPQHFPVHASTPRPSSTHPAALHPSHSHIKDIPLLLLALLPLPLTRAFSLLFPLFLSPHLSFRQSQKQFFPLHGLAQFRLNVAMGRGGLNLGQGSTRSGPHQFFFSFFFVVVAFSLPPASEESHTQSAQVERRMQKKGIHSLYHHCPLWTRTHALLSNKPNYAFDDICLQKRRPKSLE